MHTSAHTRAARSATEPPRLKRSAKLREPCKDHSEHTWQTEGWHGVRVSFRAHENPQRRGHGGRASPQCARTLPCRPPNRGKVVSVRRNSALAKLGSLPLRHMNASTSADGRLGLGPHTGQSDAPVGTKAHAQRGRRQLPAIQERCWQVNWTYPAKKPNDQTTSRTVVWTGACCPTSAQEKRGRVFDGTSQATRPKHAHEQGQQPGTGSWRSSTAPRERTSRERLDVNGRWGGQHQQAASIARARAT